MYFKLKDYKIIGEVHNGIRSTILRTKRTSDGHVVIIKMKSKEYPTNEEIQGLQREFEIGNKIKSNNVIQYLEIINCDNGYVIIEEGFTGESLDKLNKRNAFELEEFLLISIGICEGLEKIHAANIVHNDVNPSNILYNRKTGQVKIIDFGSAAYLSNENSILQSPNILEGSLKYISPEQSGRMTRAVDCRSDLYSLGITFYEMLAGRLPFETADPIEQIYHHVAKNPESVLKINPAVPSIISDIVMKLMSKSPEERYKTASGLKKDLERCLTQIQNIADIGFELGKYDFSGKFHIGQKLYGRDNEIQVLMQSFEKAAGGATELLLIAGPPGVGKSALVQELCHSVLKKQGYLIAGKFEQFQNDIPYSAIIQALDNFINQLLGESPDRLKTWKQRILQAVGNNGQVIVDVLPSLELVIGKQPPIPQLGATETQNRFNLVFENFMQTIASEEYPLVMFIDDWQWADYASLSFIRMLIANPDNKHLLVIGAYRDNEADLLRPIMSMIDELTQNKTITHTIHLKVLQKKDVHQLLNDTLISLKTNPAGLQEIAGFICDKTEGNPFFVKQFLRSLYDRGCLWFDNNLLQWCWNTEEIKKLDIMENVVDLLVSKIETLNPSTIEELQYGACIGNQFDLKTLTLIHNKSFETILSELQQAVHEGLISVDMSQSLYQVRENTKFKFAGDLFDEDKMLPMMQDIAIYYFYDFLARLAVYPIIPDDKKQLILEKVHKNQTMMSIWSKLCPMNFLHKFYLVKAELCRVTGNFNEARECYNQSINLAKKNEYLNEEALAYELTGKFYRDEGSEDIAVTYFRVARRKYQLWGAAAKVKDLENEYPDFFVENKVMKNKPQNIDLFSIMKASQAISGEINLEALLSRLMMVMLENMGAQRGFLILKREGKLLIEAYADEACGEKEVLTSLPLDECEELPKTVIRFTERTGEGIVFPSKSSKALFDKDPYLIEKKPKSFFSTAIKLKNEIKGVLYLENNLTEGIFSPDRVQVIEILSTQAAISLENALLYNTLEQKVEERTREIEKTNAELRAQKEYVEMLFNTVPSAVFSVDEENKVTSWNKKIEAVTGYSSQEVLGKECALLGCKPCIKSALLSGSADEPIDNLIYTIKNKKGETRYVSKNVDAIKNEWGEKIGRIECFNDITDRIHMEKQLRESEMKLNVTASSAGIGLWDWKVQSGEGIFNEQWAAMLGYTLDELVPTGIDTWYRLVHPEDNEKAEEILKRCFSKELDLYECEIRMKHKNREWIWILDRGRVIEWDENNKPLRMVGIHINITERKRIENELKMLKEAAETANILKNQFLANMSREIRKPGGITGETDLMHMIDRAMELERTYLTLEEANAMLEEEIIKHKRTEAALIQAKEEAEIANISKNNFISNISHELRTPIAVILSIVHLAEMNIRNNVQINFENVGKHIRTVKQNCYRLLRLVNNIIDVTKIDAGFMNLNLKNLNIINLIENMTASVVEYAKGKEINVLFDTDEEEVIMAVDPDKIERILLNLLSNAIKFTQRNGNIFVNIHNRKTKVIISVEDTGIGIPEEKKEQIFERFLQVDDTLTRKNEGSGIGLSIVRAFVELHGGSITVSSKLGKGSKFMVELPVRIHEDDQFQQAPIQTENSVNNVEMLDIEFSDIYF